MRRRVRSAAYRARRWILKAGRRERRQIAKVMVARRRQVKQFESALMTQLFGAGGEPSWDDIRRGARQKLATAAFTVHADDVLPAFPQRRLE